jgi:filamentous hemagglutinin
LEINNAIQYVERAHTFMTAPPPGTLTKIRANGNELFYHEVTNTFAVRNAQGAPRNMFRSTDGIKYWEREK